MFQPSAGRPIARIAGALSALVILAILLPGKNAEAACGQGAHSKMERTHLSSVLGELEFLAGGSSSDQAIPEVPVRRPCSGPSCSERSWPIPNPPSLSKIHGNERWLNMASVDEIPADDGSRLLPCEPCSRPVHCTFTVERPPRPASV